MKGKANTALPWMEKGDTHSMNYVYRGLANTYLETMKTLRSLKHGQVNTEGVKLVLKIMKATVINCLVINGTMYLMNLLQHFLINKVKMI